MSDPETIAFYEHEAPIYTASGAKGQNRHLDGFLALLPHGSHILELGCGGGRDAAYMVEHGFHVDATDGTSAMVKQAKVRFGLNARRMRFDELSADSKYDAICAFASLLHVPRSQLRDVFGRIHCALKPGGYHYASFKLGESEARDDLGRLYNFCSEAEYDELYERAGIWSIVEKYHYEGSGYDARARKWYALILRKPD